MSRLRLMACAAGAVLCSPRPPWPRRAVPVEIPSQDQAEIGAFGFDLSGMDTSVAARRRLQPLRQRDLSGATRRSRPTRPSYGMFDVLCDRSQDQSEGHHRGQRRQPDGRARTPAASAPSTPASWTRRRRTPWAPRRCRPTSTRSAPPTPAKRWPRLMGRQPSTASAPACSASRSSRTCKDPDTQQRLCRPGRPRPARPRLLSGRRRSPTQKAAYQAYVAQALTLAGWPEPGEAAADVVAFETRSPRSTGPRSRTAQIDKIYNPMTVAELPGRARLRLGRLGRRPPASARDRTLIVADNTAFPGMARIFAETPIETLQAWEAFHVIDQAAPYLSQAFVDARFDFRGKTLSGQPENRPRWKRGVTLVDGSLGEALGKRIRRPPLPGRVQGPDGGPGRQPARRHDRADREARLDEPRDQGAGARQAEPSSASRSAIPTSGATMTA